MTPSSPKALTRTRRRRWPARAVALLVAYALALQWLLTGMLASQALANAPLGAGGAILCLGQAGTAPERDGAPVQHRVHGLFCQLCAGPGGAAPPPQDRTVLAAPALSPLAASWPQTQRPDIRRHPAPQRMPRGPPA